MQDLSTGGQGDLVAWASGYCAGWQAGEDQVRPRWWHAGYWTGIDDAGRAIDDAIDELFAGQLPGPQMAIVRRLLDRSTPQDRAEVAADMRAVAATRAPQTTNLPRPGEWPGTDRMCPADRRAAYAGLLASWDAQ